MKLCVMVLVLMLAGLNVSAETSSGADAPNSEPSAWMKQQQPLYAIWTETGPDQSKEGRSGTFSGPLVFLGKVLRHRVLL